MSRSIGIGILACMFIAGCGPAKQELGDATQHFLAAQDALAAGDSSKAMQEFNASIEAEPSPWAYFHRARMLSDAGQTDRAMSDCRAGLILDPDHEQLKWLEKELEKPANRRFAGSKKEPPSSK